MREKMKTKFAATITLGFMAAGTAAHAQTIFRKVEKKLPGFKLTATVPVFSARTPVALMANNAMTAWVTSEHAHFVKELGKPPKDSPTKEYTWDTTPTVSYFYAPRLASVSFLVYSDSGGPHPNHWYRTFNYGVTDGKAKRLKITDLFTKGINAADIKQQITDLLLNKARLDERAMFVNDGTVTKLSDDVLNSFILERDGIKYLIGPYEFGPYAVGDFEYKLSLSELGPDFRRTLILAR